jgi:hypothetical protein
MDLWKREEFRGIQILHKQVWNWRVSSSGIWRRVVRRVVPDENHRCENLKSYKYEITFKLTRETTKQPIRLDNSKDSVDGITDFMDFATRQVFRKNTMFRKLYPFPSWGENVGKYRFNYNTTIERAKLKHWTSDRGHNW